MPKVPDIVNSAVAAGETAAAGVTGAAGEILKNVPTGITVGIKSCCVTYSGHDDCAGLPLRSGLLDKLANLPQLGTLVTILRRTPAPEVWLAMGLGFILTSSLTSILRCFLPKIWVLSVACSVLGLLFLWIFGALTWVILNLGPNLGQGGVQHKGVAFVSSIGNALSGIVHLVICLSCIRHLKPQVRTGKFPFSVLQHETYQLLGIDMQQGFPALTV